MLNCPVHFLIGTVLNAALKNRFGFFFGVLIVFLYLLFAESALCSILITGLLAKNRIRPKRARKTKVIGKP
jgi:hypothetical protein